MSAVTSRTMRADPDLTPMLDMVFQLITFFMLVINFKAASVDPSIQLPEIGSARPVLVSDESNIVVLNIAADGSLNVFGQSHEDAVKFLEEEAATERANQENPKLGEELSTTVVVRADRATQFTKVNRVLMACQDLGFRKVSLKVLDQETATK
jgi:biopolymer transport protein ExbD